MQTLTIIGNPQGLAGTALNAGLKDDAIIKIGNQEFTGKAIKETAAQIGTATSDLQNAGTGADVMKSAVGTALNAVAPGLGNVIPTDMLIPVWETMLGVPLNKPINKYSLGDVTTLVGQMLIANFNPKFWQAGLQVFGLGPPRDLGKNSNYIDPREGPKVYAPTDLFRPIIGSPNNYPHWYTGGNVIPLHSPFLALNSLNANNANEQWAWVIGQSCYPNWDALQAGYNAGKLYRTIGEIGITRSGLYPLGEPLESNIWFEFWCMPKNNPDYSRLQRITDQWLVNLWQLNGQPNPVITGQQAHYTFAPNTDPGEFWLRLVAKKNPAYYTRWVRELAAKMGANLAETMRKYGIDPNTGRITPPGTTSTSTSGSDTVLEPAKKTGTDSNQTVTLALLAAGAYFLTKR